MDVAQPIWLSGCLKEDLFIAKNVFLVFFAIKRPKMFFMQLNHPNSLNYDNFDDKV
jgi:hypothetical protein